MSFTICHDGNISVRQIVDEYFEITSIYISDATANVYYVLKTGKILEMIETVKTAEDNYWTELISIDSLPDGLFQIK